MKLGMRRLLTATVVMIAAVNITPARAQMAVAELIDDTFDHPVYVTAAPGEPDLLFVVEQTGFVRILENEVRLPGKFLNLSSRVLCCGERGLLSMAFAPDYETSGLFYVAYNNPTGDVEIDEFRRLDRLRADQTSRRRVLVIPHRGASNHNGGQLQFGRDGYLYISVGDGGSLEPRGEPARDLRSLLGKILRIDPKQNDARAYTVPRDNPFVGMSNRRPEIYAYGLRNPWRFVFDGTRIIIGDVGQGRQEEINYLDVEDASGVNFGWPQYEGRLLFDDTRPGAHPPKFPMIRYNHGDARCAVIGGYVSRDPTVPDLRGRYLYGDLCDGRIIGVLPNVANQLATDPRFTGITAVNLSSFGKGPQNQLYITQTTGELSRIVAAR